MYEVQWTLYEIGLLVKKKKKSSSSNDNLSFYKKVDRRMRSSIQESWTGYVTYQ